MSSPTRGGPPPLISSHGSRRRGQANDETSDDETFMSSLRSIEKVIHVDDQESRGLLRLATQVPKFSGQSSAQRARTPTATASSGPDLAPGNAPGSASSPTRAAPSLSHGHQGRSDALASIYNRASDAAGGAAPTVSVLPSEARWLPPSTRISELETGVVDLLVSLLQQEQQNMNVLKERAANLADKSVARSRRAPAESELAFHRLSTNRAPFTVEKPPGVIEAELSSLATALMSVPPMGQRACMLPTSQIPAQVEGLTAACHRHLSTVYRGDKNSVRGLNALRDLGQLLTEVERDTQAMSLALQAGTGDAADRWAARLGSVSKGLRPSMPDAESLAHQLEMENDLIREALKRPVPDALLQAPSRR